MPPLWKYSHVKMSFPISFWLLHDISYSNHFAVAISVPMRLELVTIANNSYNNITIHRHSSYATRQVSQQDYLVYPLCFVNFVQFVLTSFSQIL